MDREKKIVNNREFYIIAAVVALGLIIKIYYLIATKGQTLWWDEAEYMSAAKHWAFGVPYELNEQRPPLFQLLAATLLKMGFEEIGLKLFLVLLPSVFIALATYYLGKELYNSQIGIISALSVTFVWSLIFWSIRFQPDFLSVSFQILACIFFWKSSRINGSKKTSYSIYCGIFLALGFYFKISALLVPLSLALFILWRDGISLFKEKSNWIILFAFLGAMIPFLIWQAITFGNPIAFSTTYSGDFNEGRTFGWMALDFFHSFPKKIFFVLFIFGLLTKLIPIALSLDILIKNKEKRNDSSIFTAIFLIVIALFYIFYIQGIIEDRWVFLMIPFLFIFAAIGLLRVSEFIGKASKFLSYIFIIVVFAVFIFSQMSHVHMLIKSKEGTYAPVKDVSLLIKENSLSHDKILSVSYTQTTAYAEREVITYSKMSIENFTKILFEQRPSYIIVSILEPHHPEWIIQQVRNPEGFSGIILPYFNSSLIFSPQNQIVQSDIKKEIRKDGVVFTIIYPNNQEFGGLFAYKISYD